MFNHHPHLTLGARIGARPFTSAGCPSVRRAGALILLLCCLTILSCPKPGRAQSPGGDELEKTLGLPPSDTGSFVEDQVARAIARSTLGRPGGMAIAVWRTLAPSGTGTRFLTRSQVVFNSYPDFIRKFGPNAVDPGIAQSRVLLMTAHGGYGQGLQTVVEAVEDLDIPPDIHWDTEYAPLEFVSLSRIRVDLGSRYDLLILGQCNAQACLRTIDSSIPVDHELMEQIQRLSDRPRQLSIVRNVEEDIYLVGQKVVRVVPYKLPSLRGPLVKVIAPEGVGIQIVYNPKKSTMTDVYILSGRWTDRPLLKIGEEVMLPTREMIKIADRRVEAALREERRKVSTR